MFNWLRRRRQAALTAAQQDAVARLQTHDWVVVPYRVAEAARISIYTIGSHPDLPEPLRVWIAQWVQGYNAALSVWFRQNYGPDVFRVLEEITDTVREVSEQIYAEEYAQSTAAHFDQWSAELNNGEEDDGNSSGIS